jgi:transcriptional regulator with XRE-family HTH domain
MKEFFNRLKQDFADKEYAHSYMESHTVSRLAAQIHALRIQRGWSQEQLAEHSGIAQERISKIESADFDSLTMKTLQKFSRAFDVNLFIAFDSFCHGILDVANLNREQLEVKSREEDLTTSFTNKTVFVQGGSEWKAMNHLHTVIVMAPRQPLTIEPNRDTWQNLEITQPTQMVLHG